ncbi:YbaK/prolyl-tRNA synthetase associated domain-containing protein [Nonomuraea sp. NPDC001023]|uniref:YbaK/prolyl-tRNA synthetase associated domain-containing protein n=1 Tax=unclassified Nonomuraea TaxID=2593643 RepID=UPI003323F3D0
MTGDAADAYERPDADGGPDAARGFEVAEGPEGDRRPDAYERLIAELDAGGARYRVIDHPAEGRTEQVSALRGHGVEQAAKCLIVMVKIGKKRTRHVLAVVPGDARLDLQAVKGLLEGTYVAFADKDRAEELAGSVSGTVLPFSYDPRLELVVDPSLLELPEIYFNAARLDRSLALATDDYVRLAAPRVAGIVAAAVPSAG